MGLYEGIKDVAKIAQQADNIDLYKKLLDLSAQALELQDEIRKLKDENHKLKQIGKLKNKIVRHSQPYITLNDDEKQIKYCAVCWGSNHKMIQMKEADPNLYSCKKCGNRFEIRKGMF